MEGRQVEGSPDSEATKTRALTPSMFLERLGLLSGVSAAVSVVVSFVYDWGFFTALGISFGDAPTTITDHIRSWLVWLPRVGIYAAIGTLSYLLLDRLYGETTKLPLVTGPPTRDRTARVWKKSYYFIAATGPLLILTWVFLGDHFFIVVLLGLILSWFALMLWIFHHPFMSTLYPKWFRVSAIMLPIFAIYIYCVGFLALGFGGFNIRSGAYTIQVNDSQDMKSVRVLRSFENWLLVREDDAIAWIPLDHIRRMEVRKREPYPGLVCILLGFRCEPTNRAELEETPESGDS